MHKQSITRCQSGVERAMSLSVEIVNDRPEYSSTRFCHFIRISFGRYTTISDLTVPVPGASKLGIEEGSDLLKCNILPTTLTLFPSMLAPDTGRFGCHVSRGSGGNPAVPY
ncbi:hypothetical protein GE21DRAFT_195 [Neurospora crassa]|uniref:Uncharacterized protein n=1 Tax=Neurospora crassa (strain ATCC 24698 / 74-OR23-1A / CBS 708.71 / DSM 1257 / FGSC 987) TaxID=367110 RepID=A7UX86_NEUCR|nr:hypothetical protein NCU10839 [Neurospora crassa OR74A]EDO64957.2 hypothetical protein NCU10839 [Neurospora crassa OR74A]KHE82437.1 hypothetical protein GE21DRAFT_195 [Neurospora crassa]|eukprot:XP_001728048.2 hypothetical protein NCU10839 [Neurospora crassa OR74A]